MKKNLFLAVVCLFSLLIGISVSYSQDTVPTLVPPTPVPTTDPGASDALLSQSDVAQIQQSGRVRVGILYNEPPFGELTISGDVAGFDADLARSIAEAWGVELELIQVTRQNRLDMLQSGRVDLLIAAVVHKRELDQKVEFSQTYYVGRQSMMVRADDSAASPVSMVSRRIGYVLGTEGDRVVQRWLAETGMSVELQSYLTLNRAYVALVQGEIDGLVDSRHRLMRAATQPELIKLLEQPIVVEPYGIVMQRQDANMRDLVNRTLQYLTSTGRLYEIHNAHFPGIPFNENVPALWANIGEDSPTPGQFGTDVVYPVQYVAPRILSGQVLRVVGIDDANTDTSESARRLNTLHRTLIERMVSRWGVQVEFVPLSAGNPLELVASGQADLAIGVEPDWSWAGRVDFTQPYLLHGDRLMIPVNSNFDNFRELRNRWVAVMNNDGDAGARAEAWAESIDTRVSIYTTTERDLASAILTEDNADVAFGDSLKLIAHLEANPGIFKLTTMQDDTPRWYSRRYMAFAVPRNDIDFRLLVDYTLQEFILDGTLDTLLRPIMLAEELPVFDVWPGSDNYLGVSLAGS